MIKHIASMEWQRDKPFAAGPSSLFIIVGALTFIGVTDTKWLIKRRCGEQLFPTAF